MMFASDLDRTLIYSKRALQDFPTDEDLVPVEKKMAEHVSFMTEDSLRYLQEISAKILFVPVTTRSLPQYERISFSNIENRYAVTSNGATILYNGEILSEWSEQMKREMDSDSCRLEELRDDISKHFHLVGEFWDVENLFFYYTLHEKVAAPLLRHMEDFVMEKGWRISYQGRKLYFMPHSLSKGNAVTFIREREGISTLIGAGDSRLDDDFLKLCQHAYVLGHGELAQNPLMDHYQIIKDMGVQGGEKLVRTVLTLVKEKYCQLLP